MTKELLKIEDIDGDIKITCEDRQTMAAVVGVFLYKSIMYRKKEPMLALAEIFRALGGFLDEENKQEILELLMAAMDMQKKQTIKVKPSKIRS